MLVKDLKKIMEKYNEQDKEKIIIELYKKIPKYKKEDYDIDNFILNIKSNEKKKKEEKKVTFDDLEKEINYFLQCADSDLYASPNRIISKSERSKWRFKVRRYYKELNNFLPNTMMEKKQLNYL